MQRRQARASFPAPGASGSGSSGSGAPGSPEPGPEYSYEYYRARPGRFPAGDNSVDLGEINLALGSDVDGAEPLDIQRRLPPLGTLPTDPASLRDFAHRHQLPPEERRSALAAAARNSSRTVLPNPNRESRPRPEQRGRSLDTSAAGSSSVREQPSLTALLPLRRTLCPSPDLSERYSQQDRTSQSSAQPHGTASSSRSEVSERYRQLRSGPRPIAQYLFQGRPLLEPESYGPPLEASSQTPPLLEPSPQRPQRSSLLGNEPPTPRHSTPRAPTPGALTPRPALLLPTPASHPTHHRTFSGQLLPITQFERIEGGFGGVAMMQRTPSNQGMAPQNGNGNGINNGAPMGQMGQMGQMGGQMPVGAMPVSAGQQMDIHVLYSKVMELSEILKENREATQGIVQSAEQLAFRAAQSGSSDQIQEADREISASRIATLTHQNSLLASQLATLKHENRENTKLIGEYETAMGQIAEMVRDLCYRKDTARLGAEREYNARLQKEKDDHLDTRRDRDRWHSEYLRAVGMLRAAYALRESEEELPTRVVAQLQSEVRALRDVVGLEREKVEDEAGWDVLKFVPEGEPQHQHQHQHQQQHQ